MDRRNSEGTTRDGLIDEAKAAEGRDAAATSEESLPDQEETGDPMSTASSQLDTQEPTFRIGPQEEWEATLPLSTAEAFLATPQQRASVGWAALDTILTEHPDSRRWGFSRLRDEIMKRSGLPDAAASLVVFAREYELKKSKSEVGRFL